MIFAGLNCQSSNSGVTVISPTKPGCSQCPSDPVLTELPSLKFNTTSGTGSPLLVTLPVAVYDFSSAVALKF